jgi:hypothetical protein
MKNTILFLTLAFLISGCSGSGEGSSSTAEVRSPVIVPIEGTDYSGTYKLTDMQCYDPATSVFSAFAVLSPSSQTSIVTIEGNSATEVDTSSGCVITLKQKVVFNDSTNQMTVSDILASTSTGSSCNQTYNIVMHSGPAISPNILSLTVNHNQSLSGGTYDFVGSPSAGFWILNSNYSVTGKPNDLCFLKYTKQ